MVQGVFVIESWFLPLRTVQSTSFRLRPFRMPLRSLPAPPRFHESWRQRVLSLSAISSESFAPHSLSDCSDDESEPIRPGTGWRGRFQPSNWSFVRTYDRDRGRAHVARTSWISVVFHHHSSERQSTPDLVPFQRDDLRTEPDWIRRRDNSGWVPNQPRHAGSNTRHTLVPFGRVSTGRLGSATHEQGWRLPRSVGQTDAILHLQNGDEGSKQEEGVGGRRTARALV